MAAKPKRGRRRTGRPTKLADQVVLDKLLTAIRAGNYMEVSAAFAGIHKDTLYAWLKRGARARVGDPYRSFSDAMQKALAEAEVRDVAVVGQAAAKWWQAAAWRLERRSPDRWGRKFQLAAEASGARPGAAGQPVEFTLRIGSELDKDHPVGEA